jgi:hypothetical protein
MPWLAPVRLVPRLRDTCFIGRVNEMRVLDEFLLMEEGKDPTIVPLCVIVHGLGGVGYVKHYPKSLAAVSTNLNQ